MMCCVMSRESICQFRPGPRRKAIEWGIAVHQGQEYGPVNRYIMLLGCIAIVLMALSAITMWWKRRPQDHWEFLRCRGKYRPSADCSPSWPLWERSSPGRSIASHRIRSRSGNMAGESVRACIRYLRETLHRDCASRKGIVRGALATKPLGSDELGPSPGASIPPPVPQSEHRSRKDRRA
jgi:PepSY-associated TM region